MKIMNIFLILVFLTGLSFSIPITNCQAINSPGTYTLTNNIEFDADDFVENSCIFINSSDVILNCDDYLLECDEYGYGWNAIKLNASNIEIKNCGIIKSSIHILNSNYFNLNNNFIEKGTIKIEDSNLGLIHNNIINQTPYGISILRSDENNVTNNQLNNCSVYAIEIRGSDENKILGNNLTLGNKGITIIGSSDNHIENNNIYGFEYGFKEEGTGSSGAYYNWIKNNDLCLNEISMQCENSQLDEDGNFCDSSTGCGIDCYSCDLCNDPDAEDGDEGIRRKTSVSVHTVHGFELYPDECITGLTNFVNESICIGDEQEYEMKSCPSEYICSLGKCVEDSGSSSVCIDWDNLDGSVSLEEQKRTGSSCTNIISGLSYYDTCDAITEQLIEQICTSDGCEPVSLECDTCIDSMSGDYCTDETITTNCTDTDYDTETGTTIVLDVFGTATDTDGGTYSDRCLDRDTIQEAWCNPNLIGGVADIRNFECPDSYECNLTTNICEPICEDNDELNNMSYPGACSCETGISYDNCYGEIIERWGFSWQENIRQANCEDGICEYIDYPNCDCAAGENAKCFAGVCGCNDEDLTLSLRTFTFCNDPDEHNHYHKGITTFGTDDTERAFEDYCSGDELTEFFCIEEDVGVWPFTITIHYPWNEVIECPHDCEDGKCLPNTECEDHDEESSNPYIEPSFAEYDSEIYIDACLDSDNVIEQYCEAGVIQNETHYCTYGCIENALGYGSCALSSTECVDDDPLQNIYEIGNCIDYGGINKPDTCFLSQLKQSYCNGTECVYEDAVDCPIGERCVSGKCVEVTCTDSDGGITYGEEGTCEGFSTWGEDNCLGDSIIEYYCNTTTNECESIEHECESGVCLNNSCITCYDSDGGNQPHIYGECISSVNALNDTCSGEEGVFEALCDGPRCIHVPRACIEECVEGRCDPRLIIPGFPKPITKPITISPILDNID